MEYLSSLVCSREALEPVPCRMYVVHALEPYFFEIKVNTRSSTLRAAPSLSLIRVAEHLALHPVLFNTRSSTLSSAPSLSLIRVAEHLPLHPVLV
jgi:hypothetical protein